MAAVRAAVISQETTGERGHANLAPEVRYTRRAADPEQSSRTGRNQVEVLLGLTTRNEVGIPERFRRRISIGGIALPFHALYGPIPLPEFQSPPVTAGVPASRVGNSFAASEAVGLCPLSI